MRMKAVLAVLSLSLVCLVPRVTFADSLTLTDATGGSIDGVDVYPYVFSFTGPGGTDTGSILSCLNFDREVNFTESWLVDPLQISAINPTATYDGELGVQYIEDAWLYNQYGTSAGSNSEIQFAIWSIMDPGVINASNSSYNNPAHSTRPRRRSPPRPHSKPLHCLPATSPMTLRSFPTPQAAAPGPTASRRSSWPTPDLQPSPRNRPA